MRWRPRCSRRCSRSSCPLDGSSSRTHWSARLGWRGLSGQKACRDGYSALFLKAAELFRDLAASRADGSHSKHLYQLGHVDVLIVDDWAMAPLTEAERRDFLEICDTRYQARSVLLTSQLPVASWHAQIGDPTIADSILDRLVHNAHRIELDGESMRRKRGNKAEKDHE